MKRSIAFSTFFACLVSFWIVTVGLAFQIITKEMMETEVVTETDIIRNVDNFIVLFDTSSSTN